MSNFPSSFTFYTITISSSRHTYSKELRGAVEGSSLLRRGVRHRAEVRDRRAEVNLPPSAQSTLWRGRRSAPVYADLGLEGTKVRKRWLLAAIINSRFWKVNVSVNSF